jgi:AhpD family alkylhydroperoxidase
MRLPYPKLAPEAYAAMLAAGHALNTNTALDTKLLELVKLRASILNDCGFCKGMHTAELKKKHHEPDTRLDAIADYETSDAFTPREKAALRWTDVLTNIQQGHAPDAEYAVVNEFFQDKDLVDLTLAIAQINAWNRLGIAFAAEWTPRKSAQPEAQATIA